MYIEEPSQWKLGYDESVEFLKGILRKLNLYTKDDISKYLFDNKISEDDKSKILNCIKEQLTICLNENKLENYQKLYNAVDVDKLSDPDLFIRYYCENYYMIECCNSSIFDFCLSEIYFKCCLSKTEKEITEEERKIYKKTKEEIAKSEEERIKDIYNSNFARQTLYSYAEIKYKYLLGEEYNETASHYCEEIAKAKSEYNNKRISIYVGKLYITIINALKSNCVGFWYESYWQALNDYRFTGMKTVTLTDMVYLQRIMVEYHKIREELGLRADVKTEKIYRKAYEMKLPQYHESPDIDALPIL